MILEETAPRRRSESKSHRPQSCCACPLVYAIPMGNLIWSFCFLPYFQGMQFDTAFFYAEASLFYPLFSCYKWNVFSLTCVIYALLFSSSRHGKVIPCFCFLNFVAPISFLVLCRLLSCPSPGCSCSPGLVLWRKHQEIQCWVEPALM